MLFQDLSFYFKLGWHHIISADALDHQLFILALVTVYNYTHFRKVLVLVTAFTIGHSLTLFLSVLDVIRFDTKWVEFLIPCTIVFTALSNIFRMDSISTSRNYVLALAFGLIHGMGFANSIRMMLASDQHIGWGILGFNLGLEAGQVCIVILILLISYIVFTYTRIKKPEWILFVSAAVFSLALKMALERIPY